MLRRCTNRLPVDVLCCRRASSHPPYIGPDESRLGGGNPRPAPSTPCAPTRTPTTTSVDACRSRDHSAQAIDASRLGVRREHCVAGRWRGSELFTMNASDKGKAVASRWSRLNRTCTMIGRRTGCSVAPDQQCKLLTLKGLARRTGRFPQLVDPRSSINGLLLTGSPRFREVSLEERRSLAGSRSLRAL